MPDQSLPEGVERYTPVVVYRHQPPLYRAKAAMQADPEGGYIDVSATSAIIEQARSQEYQRVREALLKRWPDPEAQRPSLLLTRDDVEALLDELEDPEQPEGGDASERGHEAVPSTRVGGPGAEESGSRPETSEQPALSEEADDAT